MTTFGMEFEVQGISPQRAAERLNAAGIVCNLPRAYHETDNNWKAVYDGSVSNGAEVVSPILNPARLNEAHKVTKALKNAGARVDRATGFHVHIGLNAFDAGMGAPVSRNAENLARFILNYYAMHSAIAALVAPSRLNNRYCRILTRTYAESQASFTLGDNMGAFNGDRYTSLNLEAMHRHGTVEIRLHQGTLNGVKAIAWSQFIAGLIQASVQGVDLTTQEHLNPWSNPTAPSVENSALLIDTLVSGNHLNASTGDWLKGRAARLNG